MPPPPTWTSWSLDPLLVVGLVVAATLYVRAYRRARAIVGSRVGVGHWLPYGAGVLVVAGALMGPLDAIGDRYLLSAHMLQHVLLGDVAPALIVLGLRGAILPIGMPTLVRRAMAPGNPAGRVWHVLTRPAVALPLWAIATLGWSVPAAFDAAAADPALHALEHATLLYAGGLLWWCVIDPLPTQRRRPKGMRLAYVGFSRFASAAVCVPLTWLGTPLYDRYVDAPRAYGLSAVADQQLGGAAMCFVEFLVFGIAFAAVLLDLLNAEERELALHDRLSPN